MSIRDFNAREWEGDADDRIQRHFKYQPDCTLDSEGEKLENEAHLTAHPGTRYLHTGLDFLQYEGAVLSRTVAKLIITLS